MFGIFSEPLGVSPPTLFLQCHFENCPAMWQRRQECLGVEMSTPTLVLHGNFDNCPAVWQQRQEAEGVFSITCAEKLRHIGTLNNSLPNLVPEVMQMVSLLPKNDENGVQAELWTSIGASVRPVWSPSASRIEFIRRCPETICLHWARKVDDKMC